MQNQDVKQVEANNSNRYHVLAEMVADKINELTSNGDYRGMTEIEVADYLIEASYSTEFERCTGGVSVSMFRPDIVEEWDEPVAYYANVTEVWDAEGDPDNDAAIYINRVINSLIN